MESSSYHQTSKLLILTVFAGTMAACANVTNLVSKEDKHLPTDAYIYGNFHMRGKNDFMGLKSYQTMGFSIKCNDKTYQIRFSMDEPLQVIKIKPSVCSLHEVIYADINGIINSRKPAPKKTMHNLPIQAGKAYYFGDFIASSSSTTRDGRVYMTWQVDSAMNYFAETSQKLKENYPNLYAVPVESIMK